MKYEKLITKITIVPEGKELFFDGATSIEIIDEAGGEFVELTQFNDVKFQLRINPEEWPVLRDAIDEMIKRCRF